MPSVLGRLSPFTRRHTDSATLTSDPATAVEAPIDPDSAPIGPPMLLPRLIVRQVLVDATEFTPEWARPREPAKPESPQASAPSIDLPAAEVPPPKAPKRAAPTPRRKPARAAGASTAGTTPRRPRKGSVAGG